MKPAQRGIALISVLLIMSLALLIIGGVLHRHRLLLQSSAQQLQQIHLTRLAMAGERWALARLSTLGNPADPLALRTTTLGLDGAQLTIEIEDLSGRFNLNALLSKGQIDQVTLTRWARLLALLDLPPLALEQVGGLHELSQLRLLPGVDGAVLQRLQPWVALLPSEAALNINSAPALLLRTLEGIDATTAQALVQQRSSTPWPSVQAFTRDPLLDGLGVSSQGLGIGSRWYCIRVDVTQGQRQLRLTTEVEREAKAPRLTIRQRRLLPVLPEAVR